MLHQMYTQLLLPDPDNVVRDYDQGIRRMCSMRFAFWAPADQVLDLGKTLDYCKLKVVPGCCTRSSLAIPFTKLSPYSFIVRHQ